VTDRDEKRRKRKSRRIRKERIRSPSSNHLPRSRGRSQRNRTRAEKRVIEGKRRRCIVPVKLTVVETGTDQQNSKNLFLTSIK